MRRDDLTLPMLLTPRLLLGGAFVLGTLQQTTECRCEKSSA